MKTKKGWFLKIELIVLILVILLWFLKSNTIDIGSVKAGIMKKVMKTNPEYTEVQRHLDIPYQIIDSNNEVAKVYLQEKEIQPDLIDPTKNDFNNIDKTQIEQQQIKLLSKQDDRITQLQEWLQNKKQKIEKWYVDTKQHIPEERQNIENWYQDNLNRLQQWRNAAIEELNAADKSAAARFMQNKNNTVSYITVNSITQGYLSPYGNLNSYTSSYGNNYTSVIGDPANQFSRETTCIANNRIAVENLYQEKLRNLQVEKSRYLYNISSEDRLQREKIRAIQEAEKYVENAIKGINSNKRNIIAATEDRLSGGPGVAIQAICISGKQNFCMAGEDIYHEGDIINGFQIQKISTNEVIFEKDGKTFVKGLKK